MTYKARSARGGGNVFDFRRGRIVTKRADILPEVPPSVSVATTGRVTVKFDSEDYYTKFVQKTQTWLKSGKNVGHFATNPKNV